METYEHITATEVKRRQDEWFNRPAPPNLVAFRERLLAPLVLRAVELIERHGCNDVGRTHV